MVIYIAWAKIGLSIVYNYYAQLARITQTGEVWDPKVGHSVPPNHLS